MTSLFWRIFLTAWAIVLVMATFTIWLVSELLKNGDNTFIEEMPPRVVAHVAQDLRRLMATDSSTPADVLNGDQALDFTPLLEIYVLDPSGEDLLGRSLPEAVIAARNVWRDQTQGPEEASSRVHIEGAGLEGYLVVGYEGFFPFARQLIAVRGTVFVLLSAAMSFLLARFIVRPVRRLQRAGQKVASGDLSVRVAHTVGTRTDEIAQLAHDFDAMTERVQALLQSQQQLLRDVSHELRSPLARLQALLSIARQHEGAVSGKHVDRMEAELERLDELIGGILAYTRLEAQGDLARHPTDIVDLVQNIVDDASLEGQVDDKELRFRGPKSCVIDVDSGLIQSAVENVVRNAVRHTAQGATVDVSVVKEPGWVRIVTEDNGPGVPDDTIDSLFEPFFRVEDARSTRSGSGGVGLAIAERSVSLHNGVIEACNREKGGLRVEIGLPDSH